MTKQPKSAVNAALRAAQLAWLIDLEQQKDCTATEIARGAGLDPSTLTRFKKSRSVLSTLTVRQIADYWQVAAPPDLAGAPDRYSVREEALPYNAADSGSELDAAIAALKAGRNNCDPWVLRTRALEAIGFLAGDIVLVDMSVEPRDGDAVLAQVYDFERMQAVSVWRRFRQSGNLQLLIPASHNPDEGEPLLVNGKDVIIKGVLLPHRLRSVNKAA